MDNARLYGRERTAALAVQTERAQHFTPGHQRDGQIGVDVRCTQDLGGMGVRGDASHHRGVHTRHQDRPGFPDALGDDPGAAVGGRLTDRVRGVDGVREVPGRYGQRPELGLGVTGDRGGGGQPEDAALGVLDAVVRLRVRPLLGLG
ncbi:hypothetical protein GCM10011579_063240 [Streptomyces albiflavescens]|uniref:Uncharacterized protein n=1 Tax=Streptomyces albiflavescens TaxID=1623582 RepID=A0A917YB49_9ACTN|nr:hypothetical protein GCM10011579_063240 [Streptomyces albiflavescens]